METTANTSGQGAASQVPPEIQRWNWGAFLLSWIWGIGNNTLASLVVFVPLLGVAWLFVLGAKGSEWAWRNKRWASVEEFRAAQRRWTRWGVALWLASLVLGGAGFFGIVTLMKDAEAYKLARARLEADSRVVEIVGKPMSTGFPMGQIWVSGPRGSASLSFSVEGPKGEGTAFVEASQDMGFWHIDRLVFQPEGGNGRRLHLVPEAPDDLPAGTT